MTGSSKKLFLIDGLGALLSAFLLGIVLVRFEGEFGVPRDILYFLAIIACVLAVYSFASFMLVKGKPNIYLKIIAFANLTYCLLTAVLAAGFYKGLTVLGWMYFTGEISIIITLAIIELKASSKSVN